MKNVLKLSENSFFILTNTYDKHIRIFKRFHLSNFGVRWEIGQLSLFVPRVLLFLSCLWVLLSFVSCLDVFSD